MCTLNRQIKCHYCSGNHNRRDCKLEAIESPENKNKIGTIMEHFIANNLKCPECYSNELFVLGNHTPSLDIICRTCTRKFEVKSKCLSVNKIPADINLNHGSYKYYIKRLEQQLNLIVVIYGIKCKDTIYIKEILYANNSLLLNSDVIVVNNINNRSKIVIKNKYKLEKIDFKPVLINF